MHEGFGGGAMVPEKYAKLGFEIAKFGANSRVLRFDQKPIFVFNENTNIDVNFLTRICDTYLKLSERRRNLNCLAAN
jgi:hypothetical protein